MKYYVVGNGVYARQMKRYLKNTLDICVSGFTVDKDFIKDETIDEIPVIPSEDFIRHIKSSTCRLVMGIGYRNMNMVKERVFQKFKEQEYKFINYIHPTAIIDKSVVIGEGNNIFEGVIIQDSTVIGNANLIHGGTMIAHECNIGDYNSISAKILIAGRATIHNNCFIGANATIKEDIELADYTLVGAATYLKKSTQAFDTIVSPKSVLLEGRKSTEFI